MSLKEQHILMNKEKFKPKTYKQELEVIDWDDGSMTFKIKSGFPDKIIVVTESAWGGIEECKYEDGTVAGEPCYIKKT